MGRRLGRKAGDHRDGRAAGREWETRRRAGGKRKNPKLNGTKGKKRTTPTPTPTLGGSLPAPAGFVRTLQPKNTQTLSRKKANLPAPNLPPAAPRKAKKKFLLGLSVGRGNRLSGVQDRGPAGSLGGECPLPCLSALLAAPHLISEPHERREEVVPKFWQCPLLWAAGTTARLLPSRVGALPKAGQPRLVPGVVKQQSV